MYFVDRNEINDKLTYLQHLTNSFSEISIGSNLHNLAFERVTHMIVETILDVGNAMIDGFIMRDPGSYEDIIDIIHDEKVIQADSAAALKEIVSYRKKLVQQYLQIDHKALYDAFANHLKYIEKFPAQIRTYLDNELGPISAFKN